MKFTLKKSKILDTLAKIQGIAGKKTSNAIISCVLIKATEDSLKIYATDYETGFIGSYPAEVESEGAIAINARKLYEIVRDFPTEDILVNEVDNFWVEIGHYNVKYNLVGMNPDSFPKVPEIEDIPFIRMEARNFKKMIDKTSMMTPIVEDKRPHVHGVCLETFQNAGQNWIRILSTDGNRLAKVDYPCINESDIIFDKTVLIQKKGLNELSKIIIPQEMLSIGRMENKLFIKQQQETVSIQFINGSFPDISDVLFINHAKKINLNKHLFMMMLKRMSIFSTDDYKGVILNLNEDKMLITSTNPEIGESMEEMLIEYPDDPVEIAFNPRYFVEALSVIEEDQIVLSLVDDKNPCLIEGEKDKSFLGVIMPMRI